MSERNIKIQPFSKIDHIIDLQGRIFIPESGQIINIPEKKHLILFNYTHPEGKILPREYESLELLLSPKFSKGRYYDDLIYLISKQESIEETLKLRVQIWSKKSRWCSPQLKMSMEDIDGKKELKFLIPLSEVKEELTISGFITRETKTKLREKNKAEAALTVVSECEEIIVQIDERKEIGGNYLPIFPEDIGSAIFEIQGLDGDFELPVIKYSNEFKEYFNRDNLNSVSITFMMAMFYFLDTYLKWLIFNCKYDEHDKNHKALVETMSKYCSISKVDLINIIEDDKYSETQLKNYLTLSPKLLNGIQTDSSVRYSKELMQMIKAELK